MIIPSIDWNKQFYRYKKNCIPISDKRLRLALLERTAQKFGDEPFHEMDKKKTRIASYRGKSLVH